MPELPEIETLCRSLKELAGKTVASLSFSPLAPIETTHPDVLKTALERASLLAPKRRGKYLLFSTLGHNSLVLHLGMSGVLRWWPQIPQSFAAHTHMVMGFEDGSALTYIDARRFGTLSFSQLPNYQDNAFIKKLGPDYDDSRLSISEYTERCRRHAGLTLKSLALHQGVAAGLGNIYACEALYQARLDPRKKVGETSPQELARLLQSARSVLALGIKNGGVSMRDYLDGKGHKGIMQNFLQVYDREGKNSLDGKGQVVRLVQNQRSTFWVPSLQK